MYAIEFSVTAFRQFKKLGKDVQDRILNSLDRIKIKPFNHVTKVVGDPSYRLRVGDYRVLMDIDQGKLCILVIKIGHRSNIYSKF